MPLDLQRIVRRLGLRLTRHGRRLKRHGSAANWAHYSGTGGETTHGIAFPSSVSVGSTLVIGCAVSNTTISTPSVTAGANNAITFTATDAETTAGTDHGRMYYAKSAAAGATTININAGGSTLLSGTIVELTGRDTTAPLDKHAVASGTGTTTTGGGLTAITSGADVVSFITDDGSATTAYTAPTGFTVNALSEEPAGNIKVRISLGYINGDTNANETPAWGIPASSPWVVFNASFLAAAGGQDTPELRGRPSGLRGQNQMQQLLAT